MGRLGRNRGNSPLWVLAAGAVAGAATLSAPADGLGPSFGPDDATGPDAAAAGWAGLTWPALSALRQARAPSAPGDPAAAPAAVPEVPAEAAPAVSDVPEVPWAGEGAADVDSALAGFTTDSGLSADTEGLAGPGAARIVPGGLGTDGIPSPALRAYSRAARALEARGPACNLDWSLLAAIGRVESDHGRYGNATLRSDGRSVPGIRGARLDGSGETARIADNDGGRLDGDPAFDRALGPMQFIPGTWSALAVDGDGDGVARVQDIDDAALAAGLYLCGRGADLSTRSGREGAVFRYNRSSAYVAQVLALAARYRSGTTEGDLPRTALPDVADYPDDDVPSGPASSPDAPGAAGTRRSSGWQGKDTSAGTTPATQAQRGKSTTKPEANKPEGNKPDSRKPEARKPQRKPKQPPKPRTPPKPPQLPCTSETEPNDTAAKATSFTARCAGRRYGTIATKGDVDWVLLPAGAGSTTEDSEAEGKDLQITLGVPKGEDYELAVTTADGTTLVAPARGTGQSETVTVPAAKHTAGAGGSDGSTARPLRARIRGVDGAFSRTARYSVATRLVAPPKDEPDTACVSEVEPNDSAARATAFSASRCAGRRTGRIATKGDVDWLLLPAPGGTGASSGKDVQVRLDVPAGGNYDLAVLRDGKAVAAPARGAGVDETVTVPAAQLAKGKPVTVRVTGAAGSFSATARYALTMRSVDSDGEAKPTARTSAGCLSEVEPNDRRAAAFAATCGGLRTGVIGRKGDVDWALLPVDGSGRALQVTLDVPAGQDYALAAASAKGTTAAPRRGVGQDETITVPTTKGSRAPIRVRVSGVAGAFAAGKRYELRAAPVEATRDQPEPTGTSCVSEVEPNNTRATSFTGTCGGKRVGRIATRGDVDWALLPAPSGAAAAKPQRIVLSVPAGENYDLSVTTADGKVWRAPARGAGQPEAVTLPAAKGTPKPVRVRVSSADGSFSTTATYSLTVAPGSR